MEIKRIVELTNARLITGNRKDLGEVKNAFSSDLMSDVLTLDEENILLITGLANVQLIRTAEMVDIHVIILARNKKATPEMIELAEENGLILMESPYSIFRVSGILYTNGLKAIY